MAKNFEGPDELRRIVRNMDACTEDFNCRFSAEQLLLLGRALLASEWDIYPDEWTERQIREALGGKPPKWREPKTTWEERGTSGYVPVYED